MKDKKRLVPKRRFKEFESDDDWERRELGNVIDGLYNGQTPSRFRDDYWQGNINWLSSGELNRAVVTETVEKITIEGKDAAHLRVVPKGTFVMAITGLEAAGTRGNCAMLGIDTTLNQSCMAIYPTSKLLDSSFLFQWYRRNGEEYGIKFTQGTKQQSYNAELIKKLGISIPKIEEQTKIVEFLTNLDNLITSQQRKLEKVKDLKLSYLSDMFPKEGEKYPKIRFTGFTGVWKKKRIGDIFRVTRGDVLAATKTVVAKSDKMPYPVYSSQTKNDGLMGYYSKYLFNTAITWTTDGANAGTVNYRLGKFYSTNVNGVLLSDDGYVNKAVAEALNLVAWKHVSLVGNPKLMNNVMSDIEIFLPTEIEEHNKLSKLFENIDQLINLNQRKLEKLKDTKQAYLNEMFI